MRVVGVFKLKQEAFVFQEEKVTYYSSSGIAHLLLGPNSGVDNHMINGTKLLNVAGLTRGKRDRILKSEKMSHVVKIGPMHQKGVW